MIDVVCRTNLDWYKRYTWPHKLLGVPNQGDHVWTEDGKERLTVVGVNHKSHNGVPYLEVELHYTVGQMEIDRARGRYP